MSPLLIKSGLIVTMNSRREILAADILVDGDRISKIAKNITPPKSATVVDASGHFVIPGLIQAHTHLCQALFRGLADDMVLLDWLRKRIWPLEAGHTPESLYSSSQIGLLEMQLLGTTSILDMATVRHTESVFQAAQESGIRYWGGKCLMDSKSTSGPLYENRKSALAETELLIRKWHKKTPLIEYAICPRFGVSSTENLLRDCVALQTKYNVIIHTHASESKEEVALIRRRTGFSNVDYLDHLDMLNSKTILVHGVHLTSGELKKMVRKKVPLVHCPSSNLKLASGIAPIENYLQSGLSVALGSDGAPCNNTMDPFLEMRLAAVIQKPKFGPEALPAQTALELATRGGARALGRDDDLGSIEPGKLADLVTVDRSHPSVATVENPYSALVYSCSGRDVRNVVINGKVVVRNGEHQIFDRERVVAEAKIQLKKLMKHVT